MVKGMNQTGRMSQQLVTWLRRHRHGRKGSAAIGGAVALVVLLVVLLLVLTLSPGGETPETTSVRAVSPLPALPSISSAASMSDQRQTMIPVIPPEPVGPLATLLVSAGDVPRTRVAESDDWAALMTNQPKQAVRIRGRVPGRQVTISETPVLHVTPQASASAWPETLAALAAGRVEAAPVSLLAGSLPYDFPSAYDLERPIRPELALVPDPLRPEHLLLVVGLCGLERPGIDLAVVGHVRDHNRLDMARKLIAALADQLDERDRLAILGPRGVLMSPASLTNPTALRLKASALSTATPEQSPDWKQLTAWLKQFGTPDGLERHRLVWLISDDSVANLLANGPDKSLFIKSGFQRQMIRLGATDALEAGLARSRQLTLRVIDSKAAFDRFLAQGPVTDQMLSRDHVIAHDVSLSFRFNAGLVEKIDLMTPGEHSSEAATEYSLAKLAGFHAGEKRALVMGLTPRTIRATDQRGKTEYGLLRLYYRLPGEREQRQLDLTINQSHRFSDFHKAPQSVRLAALAGLFAVSLLSDNDVDMKILSAEIQALSRDTDLVGTGLLQQAVTARLNQSVPNVTPSVPVMPAIPAAPSPLPSSPAVSSPELPNLPPPKPRSLPVLPDLPPLP